MLAIGRVAIMAQPGRQPLPTLPLDDVQTLFSGKGIETVLIDAGAPLPAGCDLVLALGGDGTVLHALCSYAPVPVLAINFGTVGFLTAGDEEDLEQIIRCLLSGHYFVEERLMLRVNLRGSTYEVINEVVVRGITKMISVDVAVNDKPVHKVRGDGVIVGTPTGSTSYLLSTGASIVSPTIDCLIFAGINEYPFATRSIVLPPDSRITLRLNEQTRETDSFVANDGRDRLPLAVGETLEVCRSPVKARLVFFEREYFLHNLKSRLGW